MSNGPKSKKRLRNWATIVYPESAPENWKTIVADSHVPCFVSPLHDKDVNSATGEIKKAHHHLMFMFEGKKSFEQVSDFVQTFGAVGLEDCKSIRSYARYLCHLDNPEKAEYNTEDVLCFGGADYFRVIGLASDKYNALREMIKFIETNNIFSFSNFLVYCSVHRDDWFRMLCDNSAYVVKEYIFNRYWTIRNLPDEELLKVELSDE